MGSGGLFINISVSVIGVTGQPTSGSNTSKIKDDGKQNLIQKGESVREDTVIGVLGKAGFVCAPPSYGSSVDQNSVGSKRCRL